MPRESCQIPKLCLLSFGSALTFLDDFWRLILLMQEILHHLTCMKPIETLQIMRWYLSTYIYHINWWSFLDFCHLFDQARCDSLHQLMLEGLGQLLTESEVGNEKLVTWDFLVLDIWSHEKRCIKIRDFGISAFWNTLKGYNIWYSLLTTLLGKKNHESSQAVAGVFFALSGMDIWEWMRCTAQLICIWFSRRALFLGQKFNYVSCLPSMMTTDIS